MLTLADTWHSLWCLHSPSLSIYLHLNSCQVLFAESYICNHTESRGSGEYLHPVGCLKKISTMPRTSCDLFSFYMHHTGYTIWCIWMLYAVCVYTIMYLVSTTFAVPSWVYIYSIYLQYIFTRKLGLTRIETSGHHVKVKINQTFQHNNKRVFSLAFGWRQVQNGKCVHLVTRGHSSYPQKLLSFF